MKNSDENGKVALNKNVFGSIVQISMDDVEGLLKEEDNRFHNPITVKIEDNKLMISVEVKVQYGSKVNQICENLQHKVYDNILLMTNIKCSQIEIKVTGFEFA